MCVGGGGGCQFLYLENNLSHFMFSAHCMLFPISNIFRTKQNSGGGGGGGVV